MNRVQMTSRLSGGTGGGAPDGEREGCPLASNVSYRRSRQVLPRSGRTQDAQRRQRAIMKPCLSCLTPRISS